MKDERLFQPNNKRTMDNDILKRNLINGFYTDIGFIQTTIAKVRLSNLHSLENCETTTLFDRIKLLTTISSYQSS